MNSTGYPTIRMVTHEEPWTRAPDPNVASTSHGTCPPAAPNPATELTSIPTEIESVAIQSVASPGHSPREDVTPRELVLATGAVEEPQVRSAAPTEISPESGAISRLPITSGVIIRSRLKIIPTDRRYDLP